MYEYKAIVDRVVDGDTIKCTIDLGFSTWKKVTVRMEGINTPESRTRDLEEKKLGLAAKDRLIEMLEYNDNKCVLKVSGLGKFGRALATVYVDTLSSLAENSSLTEININQQLIEEGHAVVYFGGKRK
jgi:micrococcal nuclease